MRNDNYEAQQTSVRDLQRDVNTLGIELRELKALIAKEGLQNLEKRISRLKNELKKTNDRKDALIHQRGGYQHESDAHFMYRGKKMRLHALLFDEAFYGIDAGRRDQILGFATDLGLQLFIASPDQDGVSFSR